MSNDSTSLLRFNNFSVDSFDYKRNYHFHSEGEEISLEFQLNAQASISESNSEAIIILSCKIFEDEYRENKAPFYLDLSMRGFFDCVGEVDISSFKLNGMAILLPYLRSIITSFTAQSGISPVILPPINVFKLFDDENHDEKDSNE